jgi:hypothetical protein
MWGSSAAAAAVLVLVLVLPAALVDQLLLKVLLLWVSFSTNKQLLTAGPFMPGR